jgi:GT2 family glycosyltransferase
MTFPGRKGLGKAVGALPSPIADQLRRVKQRVASAQSPEPPSADENEATRQWRQARRLSVLRRGGFQSDPLVAIVVPARNEEQYIKPCLASLREQHFDSWECIVVDDGSTDGTVARALDFERRDSRFTVVSHEASLGVAAARNTGLELTSAPFVTFLDGDDFLYLDSLEQRVLALLEAASDGWVAGVYCDWRSTRENQDRVPPTQLPTTRSVAGFHSGPDCPFIATAPMLHRDVLNKLGGFNEALPAAADYDLWVRILRAGYRFNYVPHVGVAFRQKRSGMVFQDSSLLTEMHQEIVDWQFADLSDVDKAPHFPLPIIDYQRKIASAARLLQSYAIAEAAENPADKEQIIAMMPTDLDTLARHGVSVDEELNHGLRRASKAIDRFVDEPVRRLAVEVMIADLSVLDLPQTGPDSSVDDSYRVGAAVTSPGEAVVRARAKPPVAPLKPGETPSGSDVSSPQETLGLLMMPMARYHAREMNELAALLLKKHNIRSTFVIDSEFQGQFDDEIISHPVISLPSTRLSDLPLFSGVFVMNDWGASRKLLLECRLRDVPSFARVEGVQDFRDLDTQRIRLPYLTADHVLAQGRNDLESLRRESVHLVGNERLESIFRGPERTVESRTGRVVINSNFTYGVLMDKRADFLESSIKACVAAGLEPVISRHPADSPLDQSLQRYVADEAMSDLLHTCDMLISRFSTVPFEAMALGTPFVYFNPHGELVDTFFEPGDAYRIADSAASLTEAITEAMTWLGNYRQRSEKFLREQIDMRDESAVDRTARCIVELI